MKRKNGFTLIELLAVIIILGIIVLIAVPTVKDVMDESKKKAFMNTAYGIVEAGELYHAKKDMLDEELVEETFLFPNGADELKIKGKLPKKGRMIINEDGDIAMAISDGKYCITKSFENEDVIVTDSIEKCVIPRTYKLGDIVYYNPVEDSICTNYVEANSALGVKDECMRWYVYGIEQNNLKLILDHNTTAEIGWKETVKPLSLPSETKNAPNTLINRNTRSILKPLNDTIEPIELMNQLESDTANWKTPADIITLEEVLNLLPYYQKLSSSEKQAWLDSDEEVIFGYFDVLDAAIEEMPDESTVEELKSQIEFLEEDYPDLLLPKYMYEDMLSTCEIETGYSANCDTYGYWTKSLSISNGTPKAWSVDKIGFLDDWFYTQAANGLRPVIKISK